MRTLVVVAVAAERDAVLRGAPSAEVVVGGVGPVSAAVATARTLAGGPDPHGYDAVLNLGVAGAFDPVDTILIGTAAVAADLGVETGDGIALDLVPSTLPADPALLAQTRAAISGAACGELLTVWTVTSTASTAARLHAAHPDAVGEAMEGFGVAAAALEARVPFLEVRTVSNPIGPRDRAAWDLAGAFARLADVAATVLR